MNSLLLIKKPLATSVNLVGNIEDIFWNVDADSFEKLFINRKNRNRLLWDALNAATQLKGANFSKVNDKLFNRNDHDVEIRLGELDGQLASEDYGKHLVCIQNLQKKLVHIDNDYNAHNECVEDTKQALDGLIPGKCTSTRPAPHDQETENPCL
uniref:Ferroxidase n=1 Tax=Panagrellus redivivus TaxID=6233 RepID=A0A7E4V0B4_PANRE